MYGVAEKNIFSKSRELVDRFKIGETYSVSDIEDALGYKPGGADRKGVLGGDHTDYLVLKITFQKVQDMNHDYYDHIYGSTLFWSSQRNRRFAERCACDGKHDVFIFVRVMFRSDFIYYGRAVPVRLWNSMTDGIPSNVVFEMPEYAQSEWYQHQSIDLSYDHDKFRKDTLDVWKYRASAGEITDPDFLVSRHIKPVSESSPDEIRDATNSLLLTPTLDNLFSRGIITFSDTTGKIILPDDEWHRYSLNKMNVTEELSLNDIPKGTDSYLQYHKTYIYGFESCRNGWMIQ